MNVLNSINLLFVYACNILFTNVLISIDLLFVYDCNILSWNLYMSYDFCFVSLFLLQSINDEIDNIDLIIVVSSGPPSPANQDGSHA